MALTKVTSHFITGTITNDTSGNAGTVTNGIYTNESHSNPSWITGLAWSKITGAPAFITGITSSNVTTALGFTPYNATNPSGYITSADGGNAGTLDSIDSSSFLRSDTADTATGLVTFAYDDDTDYSQIIIRGTDNHSGIIINPTASKQAHLRFYANGTEKWQIRAPFQDGADTDLKIFSWVGGTDRFTFNHSGLFTAVNVTATSLVSAGGLSITNTGDIGGNLTVGSASKSSDTFVRVLANDSHEAGFEAFGNNQGTGYLYVGQNIDYGGGISYNGDGSPSLILGETNDHITFFRRDNGTNTEVFHYAYNSNNVNFNGNITTNYEIIWGNGYKLSNGNNSNNAEIQVATTGSSGIVLKDSGGTFKMQLYGEGGHYGFLTHEWGSWDLKKANNGELTLRVSGTDQTAIHSGNIGSQTVATATTATTANAVSFGSITGGARVGYDFLFRPSSASYGGFTFENAAGTHAGYMLIRDSSDAGNIYRANGITVVADSGWLTLAQRTANGVGVRIMTGSTSAERINVVDSTTTISNQLHASGVINNTSAGAFYGRNHAYPTPELKGYGAEFMIGAMHTDIHINYRTCNGGTSGHTPINWYWRAGSSSSYSNHYFGSVQVNGNLQTTGYSLLSGSDSYLYGGSITSRSGSRAIHMGYAGSCIAQWERTGSSTSAVLLSASVNQTNLYSRVTGSSTSGRTFVIQMGNTAAVTVSTSRYVTLHGGSSSDIILKKNIEDHSYGLDAVNNLKPRKFNWKEHTLPLEKQVGFIAQELEEVVPEAVYGFDGAKAIIPSAMISVLTKAIQELSQQVTDLKAEVELLKQ